MNINSDVVRAFMDRPAASSFPAKGRPNAGDLVLHRSGQLYAATGVTRTVSSSGSALSFLAEWLSHCPRCGSPFAFEMALGSRRPRRLCQSCAVPGDAAGW